MALAETTRAGVEDELREAIRIGRLVDWRTGDPTIDNPSHGAGWDVQRTVAAALLAELLTTPEGSRRPRALRLAGARIVGQLDLEAAELVCPLLLRSCWFAEPIVLDDAQASVVRLPGCHLPSLSAIRLTTRGALELNDGFNATRGIVLLGADIGGKLDLSGATLTNPDGSALIADQLAVTHSVFCRAGFSATGEIRLLGAHIGGVLDFRNATLTNPNGFALAANGITVDRDVLLWTGFSATGGVTFLGAKVGRQLDLSGAALTLTNPDKFALDLQELTASALILRGLVKPPELMRLTHAKVGALVDEPASWPSETILDGFVYDALYEQPPVSARQRLDWLASGDYSPQPYEQLAAVYRRAGRDED